MTRFKSSLREQPPPTWSRPLKVALPVLLCSLLLVVVGTILASLSPPTERESLSQANTASELDLMAGDSEHNQAIAKILAQLESDGYLVNGTQAIAEQRWEVLRGRQSVMSPHESQMPMEWRLMVCPHPHSTPHSFVAARLHDASFNPQLLKAFENEWLQYAHPLPAELIVTAQTLLARAATYRAEDQEAVSTQFTEAIAADVVHRRWQAGDANAIDTALRYRLKLKQATPRYDVIVELHDDQDIAGNASGCWICIDFIRRTATP